MRKPGLSLGLAATAMMAMGLGLAIKPAPASAQLNEVLKIFSADQRRSLRRRARRSSIPILAHPPALPPRHPRRAATAEPAAPAPQIAVASPGALIPPAPASRRAAQPTAPTARAASPTQLRPAESAPALIEPEPEPEVWTQPEITAALRQCAKYLGPITATIEPADPVRKGQCGMPAPVRLSKLGAADVATIAPPATVNCRTAAALYEWIETEVQPAARSLFRSPVVRIRNVSGYVCRNRNGAKTGRISEHAFGNALDIARFELANGREISVLGAWGPVARDAGEPTAGTAPASVDGAAAKVVLTAASANGAIPLPELKGPVSQGRRLRGTIPQDIILLEPQGSTEPAAPPASQAFLHRIHKGACRIFGTVLGPEANDAHRDHLHLDTARRRSGYCR